MSVPKFTAYLYCIRLSIPQIYIVNFGTLSSYQNIILTDIGYAMNFSLVTKYSREQEFL